MKQSLLIGWVIFFFTVQGYAQYTQTMNYKIETSAIIGGGHYAPFWFTANTYGVNSESRHQVFLRSGVDYQLSLKKNWKLDAGIDILTGLHLPSDFWAQQAFAGISWKQFSFIIGSKERKGGPLEKNQQLTAGWMVEGANNRPIPQIRMELTDYFIIPRTGNWLSFKGHLSYGWFIDGRWQENFVSLDKEFTRHILYHSKSLMLRLGNKEEFPAECEFGIQTSAQFGGQRFKKLAGGSRKLVANMPHGIKEYFNILIPKQQSTLQNVSGNHCGSWNFAVNAYVEEWKIKTYYEHYFEDHSQMFWQYGRWKDGLIGVELIPTKNRLITSIVWEGMSTKDQTGPILYDGVGGTFEDLQMSGDDNYYNNLEYLGWQYYGASLGHPFLYGPQYNTDGSNEFKSTRIRSNHFALSGKPFEEWNWRLLTSFVRHWGTYRKPLDKQRKQFSGLLEISYKPKRIHGWSMAFSIGVDRGNYLGNNIGSMLRICKSGGLKL